MAKDIIPLVNLTTYKTTNDSDISIAMHNVITQQVDKQQLALSVRPTLEAVSGGDTTGFGRGCFLSTRDHLLSSAYSSGVISVVDDTVYFDALASSDTMLTVHISSRAYFTELDFETVILNPGREFASNGHTSDVGSLYYRDSTTTIAQVTLPSLYLAHGVENLNGRVYVLDQSGALYNSDLDDITTFGATNFITAERKDDPGVFLAKQKEHLIVFGTKSIEFFYDAGNSPNSPLNRRADIFHNTGTLFPNSVQVVGDDIYFIGSGAEGNNLGIYRLREFKLTKISTNLIDDALLESLVSSVGASAFIDHEPISGHINYSSEGDYVVFTINEDVSYVFSATHSAWFRWYMGGDPTSTGGRYTTFVGIFPLIGHSTGLGAGAIVQLANGQLATFTGTGLTDVGVTATEAVVYTPLWDKDTNERKKISYTRLLHNSLTSDATPDPTVEIDWVDDPLAGTSDFTGGRSVNTNTMRARLSRCGMTRQRIYKVTLDANNGHQQILRALELNYEQLRG